MKDQIIQLLWEKDRLDELHSIFDNRNPTYAIGYYKHGNQLYVHTEVTDEERTYLSLAYGAVFIDPESNRITTQFFKPKDEFDNLS